MPVNKDALCHLNLFETGQVVLKSKILKKIVFFQLQYYLILEMGMTFHLNKLESLYPKDALCQVWLELIPEKNFTFLQCIFAITLLSTLGKEHDPCFE